MGWWSKDIMGGDTPLDYKDEIYGICGVDEFPETGKQVELSKEDIEGNLEAIIAMVREACDYDKSIAFQVLGICIMKSGASLTEELKAEIIEASLEDEWAQVDKERKAIIDSFVDKIKSYSGAPIKIESKGLIETMLDSMHQSATNDFIQSGKKIYMVFSHITPEDRNSIVESMYPEDIAAIKSSDIVAVEDVDSSGELVTYMVCTEEELSFALQINNKYKIETDVIEVTSDYLDGNLRIEVDEPYTPWLSNQINQI